MAVSFDLDGCRVFASTGELLADGFVRESTEHGLLVEAEHFTGRWLEHGDGVVVQVLSAVRGECTYDAQVEWAEAGRIEVSDLRLREAVQKRGAVRVPTDLPFRVVHALEGVEEVPFDPPLDVVVLDVSAHGMRVAAPVELPPGTRFVLDFAAEGVRARMVLNVLRSVEAGRGFAHGCAIEGLDERRTDDLFSFVLAEQRRQRAARMNSM